MNQELTVTELIEIIRNIKDGEMITITLDGEE